MKYIDLYHLLKEKVNYTERKVQIDDLTTLYNREFRSHNSDILPGEFIYHCHVHGELESDDYHFVNSQANQSRILNVEDVHVKENEEFSYHIFNPTGIRRSRDVILLFNGLNEKYWTKYLPWAKRLSEVTGKTVVLFPIAFHMNRAPHAWSERRLMQRTSEQRKGFFPQIMYSTISNVAISTRLHVHPQRFFWSGLQTYYDVIQFIQQVKSNGHDLIDPEASFDIFSYSIGCLLSEILMMTNYKGYFDNSRLCMFCGGAVFNRLSPASKFILDSEANVALYSYVVEHLEGHLEKDSRLRHYLVEKHPEGINFKAMLNYKTNLPEREEAFRKLSNRMMAIALKKDTVVPPYEVINTLQGSLRDIPVKVEVLDFPYTYRHEDPFPVKSGIAEQVNEQFEKVFDTAGDFLK